MYLLILVSLLALAACGDSESRTPTGPSGVVLINCQDTRTHSEANDNTSTTIITTVGDGTCGDRTHEPTIVQPTAKGPVTPGPASGE